MAVESYNLGCIYDDYLCAIGKITYLKTLARVNNVNILIEIASYILNVRRYSELDICLVGILGIKQGF